MASSYIYNTLLVIAIGFISVTALPMKRSASLRISNEEEIKHVKEGHPIEIDCTLQGVGPTIVYWLHDGKLIQQSPLDRFAENTIPPPARDALSQKTQGRLVIARATRAHAGKYTCVAETETSKTTRSITVEVEHADKPIIADSNDEHEKLRIYQVTEDVLQVEGSDLYLVCRATQGANKNVPIVTWAENDTPIETNIEAGIIVHDNGDLEIKGVTSKYHWGNTSLKCIATGDDGKVVEESPFVYIA